MVFVNITGKEISKSLSAHDQEKTDFLKIHKLEIKKFEEDRKAILKNFDTNKNYLLKNSSLPIPITNKVGPATVVEIDFKNFQSNFEYPSKIKLIKEKFLNCGSNTSAHGKQ